MYQYDAFDTALVQARVDEFRDQVDRRMSGELSEDQFKPLRLMNGFYLQLHARGCALWYARQPPIENAGAHRPQI
jgi:sulfite reductase beta subunit-like hemoprotein